MNYKIEWHEALCGLLAAPTEAAFLIVLSNVASDLGFEYSAYGMRLPRPLSNPKLLMVNNYPTQWQQHYAKSNYLALDPTVAHGMRSVSPVLWSDRTFGTCPAIWNDAREHGLRAGWAQSSFDAQGVGGMLTLARSSGDITAAELRHQAAGMSWLVHAAHEGMTRLLAAKREPEPPIRLTPRELDVLRWTADGKTSGEVGQIMSISERTVNFHVNNSIIKLGVVNKTAGVVKAAMLRLL